MAKYKLISPRGWGFKLGTEIDTEKSINGIKNTDAKDYVRIYPDDWELVPEEEPMKEKEIIGYKLKDYCIDYYQASCDICSGLSVSITDVMKLELYTTVISKLNKAGVLNLWFDPVYKQAYPDMTINGYKGEFFDTYVKFGCAKIAKEAFIEFYRISKMFAKDDCLISVNSNRDLTSITIGKGTFTKDQIKQIAEYYLNKK